MTRNLFIVAVTLALAACVSQKTQLRNAEGKTVVCDNWGFGFIGAPVAMAQHADCMKKAKAAGYSEAPQSPPAQ